MAARKRAARVVVVFVEALLAAAAIICLAELLGYHVLSQAGGAIASAL